jgi:2-keto-4-pentenoate hydratase
VTAHLIDIDAVPYLGCGARDADVTRGNADAVLGSPPAAVAWPARTLVMVGL